MGGRSRGYEDEPAGRRGAGIGALILMTAVGVGIGLLAAPETGVKTRRRIRRKLAALGEDLGEGLEEVQELGGRAREFGGRAREQMRERLAAIRRREAELDSLDEDDDEEEETESGMLGTVFAVAAGAAATYFLASERAAPARSRVRETAETVRRKASDRWDRFQQSRANGYESGSETASGVPTSDEPPLGS